MKSKIVDGVHYRGLADTELAQRGDYTLCQSHGWCVFSGVTYPVSKLKAQALLNVGCADIEYYRECDPLIAAMMEVEQ